MPLRMTCCLTVAAAMAMAGCGDDDAGVLSPADGPVDDGYASVRAAFPDTNLARAVVAALRETGEETTDPGDLTMLDAGDMGVRNLAGVELLTGLRALSLSANAIVNLQPLSTLVRLQMLDLSYNQVTDLGALAGLDSLVSLDLTANRVEEIGPLLELQRLEQVYLADNGLNRASASEHIPQLRERGVEVGYPLSPENGAGTAEPTTETLGYWGDPSVPGPSCLAVDAEGRLYAGTSMAADGDTLPALLVSGDLGQSWQSVIEEALPGSRGPIDALQVNAEYPETILAHTMWGFVRSADGGRTWEEIPGLYGVGNARFVPIIRDDIVASPNERGVYYLLTLGGFELHVSSDHGATWAWVHSRARAVAVDGTGGLYVSTGDGVLHSTDMGVSMHELPFDGGWRVLSLATDGQEGQVLYAGTREGVYRSRDGGRDWELVLGPDSGTWVLTRVEADPHHPQVVCLMAAPEPESARQAGLSVMERLDRVFGDLEPLLHVSSDAGDTWFQVDMPGSARDVAFDPTGSGWIYVATSEGVSRLRP